MLELAGVGWDWLVLSVGACSCLLMSVTAWCCLGLSGTDSGLLWLDGDTWWDSWQLFNA